MILINNLICFICYLFLKIKKNHKLLILSLIFISIITKIILLIFYDITQPPDARKYTNIVKYYAERFSFFTNAELSFKFILTAPYMKIYPSFIYFFGKNLTLVCQIIMSSFGIYLIFEISKLLTKDIFVSSIAALLFFSNPFLTYYSLTLQYETFFIFFLLSGILLFLKKLKKTSYLFLLITIFINPVIEIGILLFIFFTSLLIFKYSFKKSLKNFLVFLLLYAFLLCLNIYNNYRIFGVYERFYINSVAAYEYNEAYEKYGLNHKEITQYLGKLTKDSCPIDPAKANDIFYYIIDQRICENKILNEYALNYITDPENFIHIVKNFFVRIGRLFSLYPYDTKETHVKIISSIYYSFLYFFLAIFFLRKKNLFNKNFYPIIIFTLFSLSVYIAIHALFRYRVSYDPFLIILASNVIKDLINKVCKDRYNQNKFI